MTTSAHRDAKKTELTEGELPSTSSSGTNFDLSKPQSSPKLSQTSRLRNKELAALHRIAVAITSTLEIDEILTSTMEGIRQILNVETGSLLMVDDKFEKLVFKKTLEGDPEWMFQVAIEVGQGIVGKCVETGQAIYSNDTSSDPHFYSAIDSLTGIETRSVLCAPLIVKGQTLGAIEVINKRNGPFDDHDRELLVSMAAGVAHSIYHAQLFQEVKVANADLEAQRWELLRSQSILQTIFDGITSPLYIIDKKYRLIAVNKTFFDYVKAEPSQVLNNRCYKVLHDRDDACPRCLAFQTLQHGIYTQWNVRHWNSGSGPEEWEFRTYPIKDKARRPDQAIVFAQDVSERRQHEASLAQSERLAAVGQLASGVAHEINNPLTAIIASAQILQRDLIREEDRKDVLDTITRAGEDALHVVGNLLEVAQQDVLEFTPLNINETIRKAIAIVENQLKTRSISLVLNLKPDLPPLLGSFDHLQNVWLNLILNARDSLMYRPGEISISSERVRSTIQVSFLDHGEYIPPERMDHIFEPYYTDGEQGRGTGLGLATCHRIIRQHRGRISVNSHPDKGTEFTVIVPLETAPLI